MSSKTETLIKKYQTYIRNLEWNAKEHTGERKKDCITQMGCYKEALSDILSLSTSPQKEVVEGEGKIAQWEAKKVANTLRIVSNMLESHKKETCLDRQVMDSIHIMNRVLGISTTPDKSISGEGEKAQDFNEVAEELMDKWISEADISPTPQNQTIEEASKEYKTAEEVRDIFFDGFKGSLTYELALTAILTFHNQFKTEQGYRTPSQPQGEIDIERLYHSKPYRLGRKNRKTILTFDGISEVGVITMRKGWEKMAEKILASLNSEPSPHGAGVWVKASDRLPDIISSANNHYKLDHWKVDGFFGKANGITKFSYYDQLDKDYKELPESEFHRILWLDESPTPSGERLYTREEVERIKTTLEQVVKEFERNKLGDGLIQEAKEVLSTLTTNK